MGKHSGFSRSKYSFYNAASAMLMTVVNGLLGIVVTRFVIARFGSDFNGLNSTANQIVNILLMLEGGFTLASNVALFAPLTGQDYGLVNGILAATRKRFRRIGAVFFLAGLLAARVYAAAVKSGLPKDLIVTVITMAVVPSAFNLFYASTYRVLLQAQQKEYVISLITASTLGMGHLANIAMMTYGGAMWMVRCNTMLFALANSLLIARYAKKRNPFMDLSAPPRRNAIKGTGDVMVQKITGVIYNSVPIVFLSVAPAGGTVLASVYAVYNNVFLMMKSLLHAVTDAPRLGFGQMLTQRTREEVWPVFAKYEYAVCLTIFTLLTTAYVLILPFVAVYTRGVSDAEYRDPLIALLMVLITVIETLHIPSGHLINMAGKFKVSKNFQVAACAVLVVSIVLGEALWGMYGILAAVLLVAVLLAALEMGYVHVFFFKRSPRELARILLPLAAVGCAVCWAELRVQLPVNGYASFFVCGVLLVLVNGAAAGLTALVFERERLFGILTYGRRVFSRR